MTHIQGKDAIKPVTLEGKATALDRNGNKVVKIGKYWFSTDVNRFWELLSQSEDEQLIYCYLIYNDRIFSTTKRYFKAQSRTNVYRRFERLQMCFLDPEIQKVYQEGAI